ncbi:hypothetical protein BU26DRAFT_414911 [Trematosphaeria pertusa]|uniref:Uncharacterized protein n=1 Tax=Trematosphaeria pertusa TaxID=390896 RepID=A0A6A6J7A3_9PLEO|nr:uncharacterized protein BU26DRAFT_414911 [Trematosphaeria pertusa]KAF2257333.1 hypothetical protein BU26DRAFT_414911 [Trematosphaeria pertusa]
MLTLQRLLSLPVFLSTTLIAHALAAPGGFIDDDKDGGDDKPDYAAALTGGEDCNDKALKAIREGFHEMNKLFAVTREIDWSQEPEIEFFGREDRIANYTDMIAGNLLRAQQYANLKGNAARNPDIHVRCDDPNDMCDEGNKKDGKHVAYNIGNEPHINFCKKYFDLDPLDEEVDEEASDSQTRLDLLNYYNRATAWARMVMHFSDIGQAVVVTPVPTNQSNSTSEWTLSTTTGPMNTSVLAGVIDQHPDTNGPNNIRVLKYAYGVTRAKLLATLSTQEPYDAANNAENYALYAQARYVLQEKQFFPNMPIMSFGNDLAVLSNEQIQDGDRKRFACFDMSDVV